MTTALSELDLEGFRDLHGPCEDAVEWVQRENIQSLAEAWDKAKPEWLIWMATREGVLSERQQRLFACWCVRQVWHLLSDDRSRQAVEVAERYAVGDASTEELDAAWSAASAVARDAARAAVSAAARDAAHDAARDVAWSAANAAAWDAASAAASAAARLAASAVARDAARAAQADYLRPLNPFRREES